MGEVTSREWEHLGKEGFMFDLVVVSMVSMAFEIT